jgi:hypothetical protein
MTFGTAHFLNLHYILVDQMVFDQNTWNRMIWLTVTRRVDVWQNVVALVDLKLLAKSFSSLPTGLPEDREKIGQI